MRFVPQPCAEFPNDNPDLHDGASWVCAWTRARPRAVVSASGVARSVDRGPSAREDESGRNGDPVVAARVVADPVVADPVVADPVVAAAPEFATAPQEAAPSDAAEPMAPAVEIAAAAEPFDVTAVEQASPPTEPSTDAPVEVAAEAEPVEVAAEAAPIEVAAEAEPIEEPAPVEVAAEAEPVEEPAPVEVAAEAEAEEAPVAIEEASPPTQPSHEAPEAPAQSGVTEAPPRALFAYTPEDDQRLDAALNHFLGPEASTPSENLSVLLAAVPCARPLDTTLEPAPVAEVPAVMPQQLDLLPPPPNTQLSLDLEPRPARAGTPSRPAPAKALSRPLPEFTTPLPRPARVPSLRGLPDERAADAVSALDALFDGDGIEWQTPDHNLAVQPRSASFRVPRPAALAPEPEARVPLEPELELEPLALDLTPPPPGVAGWEELAHFVSGFLLTRSATRGAALVGALLMGRVAKLERLPDTVKRALLEAGIAEKARGGLAPTAAFREQASAFQQDFMGGRVDAGTFLPWLSCLTRAFLANGISHAAVRVHLEQAGIERLLRRAA